MLKKTEISLLKAIAFLKEGLASIANWRKGDGQHCPLILSKFDDGSGSCLGEAQILPVGGAHSNKCTSEWIPAAEVRVSERIKCSMRSVPDGGGRAATARQTLGPSIQSLEAGGLSGFKFGVVRHPAQAGTQFSSLDPRLRGNDEP